MDEYFSAFSQRVDIIVDTYMKDGELLVAERVSNMDGLILVPKR